ncbi:NAD(P)-dependent oxidoreductase, partial [Microvirga arabica]
PPVRRRESHFSPDRNLLNLPFSPMLYVPLEELLALSDIVSLHCPLTPATHHLIDAQALGRMKRGVILVNTSRGAVIDTRAALRGLKDGTIGHLGLDVYEEEADLFFEDLSQRFIGDDVFARLLTFPNVLITGHQAFFTREALTNIAEATISNITSFERTGHAVHEVSVEKIAARGQGKS